MKSPELVAVCLRHLTYPNAQPNADDLVNLFIWLLPSIHEFTHFASRVPFVLPAVKRIQEIQHDLKHSLYSSLEETASLEGTRFSSCCILIGTSVRLLPSAVGQKARD
jgi:hypothetical protein